jgi:histidine triad (HIT) family protein
MTRKLTPMPPTADCIFCRIAAGEAPAIRIYEDSATVAFMDIAPASDGHLLVIPRDHHASIIDASEAVITEVAKSVQRLARAVEHALTPDGIRVNQFNGRAAGQTVFHYHVHLVPIRAGERAPSHGRSPGDTARIESMAERIRSCL